MNPNLAKQQIAAWDKNPGNIDIVDTGATNLIGLTDSMAYRFPVTEDALSIQFYEAALYKRLDNRLNVPIPRFVRKYEKPACIVITRLEGHHLTVEDLASFSPKDLRSVIRTLLEFNIQLNKIIDIKAIKELESTYIADKAHERPWLDYLSHHLKETRFPGQPWLEDLAHEQYAKWLNMVHSSTLPSIVVHDELHTGNLLFIDRKISGIIDFGDSTVGTIAQELRQLLRISKEAVRVAIDEYAVMTGVSINFEEVTTWAIAQELASYCRWASMGEFKRQSFTRSRSNLINWLAGFKG